jgi:aldehyde:ferredoxin oxidoreductase
MSIIGSSLKIAYDRQARRAGPSYNGKILRVDLTDGKLSVEEPNEAFYRKYIGGRGIALHYLLSEIPAGIDALDPQNLLVFASGVLTGTVLPGTGRHGVAAKSPLTGALASGEAGGWWGAELKKAGFDAVVIRGCAEKPVYLWIKDGEVEIRDAGHLWGQNVAEAQDMIRSELGDEKIRISQIGPAGEKLVRYACILNNAGRAAGRSGLGAVMGSKNLKAIAVRGSSSLGVADKDQLSKTVKWITSNYKENMAWAIEYGTANSVPSNHDTGALPMDNYRSPSLEGVENISAEIFFPRMLKMRDTCAACPVRCKNVLEFESEELSIDSRYSGPEYETLGALGPLTRVVDLDAVLKASELCEVYGLDTISTGGTIAFTMECVEQGLLTAEQGYDFLPEFGDGASLVESIHRIAQRRGIGALMAEGSARMAQTLGSAAEEMVVATRGQELPMHDPRLKNAYGLGYAVSATGADHMANMDDVMGNMPFGDVYQRSEELGFEVPLPLFGIPEVKVRAFICETAFKNFLDSALICHFYPYLYHHVVDALNGATGWDVTRDEILEIGNRIVNMGRVFLLREGFTASDDKLPTRMFKAHETGPIAGKAMTPEEFQTALENYYHFMGWGQDGVPTAETLEQLGL